MFQPSGVRCGAGLVTVVAGVDSDLTDGAEVLAAQDAVGGAECVDVGASALHGEELAAEFFCRAAVDHGAGLHDDDVVGEQVDFGDEVGADDDGAWLFGDKGNNFLHKVIASIGVHAVVGFVQDGDGGPGCEGGGHGQGGAFTGGELFGAFGEGDVAVREHVGELFDGEGGPQGGEEFEVVVDFLFGQQDACAVGVQHVLGQCGGWVGCSGGVGEGDAACGVGAPPGEGVPQGGFTGAVGAHQGGDLTGGEGSSEVVKCWVLPVRHGDVFC